MFDLNTSYLSGDGRSDKFRNISISPTVAIIALCILSFIVELIPGIGPIYVSAFEFNPGYILTRPWTLITYIFLHTGLLHLFFNMFVLFFLGTTLERIIDKKQFLEIFIASGILSAIGYSLLSYPIFNISPGSMIGASGAVYGVFAALTMLEPDLRVYVYFIPMKLKHALLLFALFDFLMVNSSDMIAHTAHLSGILVGLYMGSRIKNSQKRYHNPRNIGRW
jgi:membrane associated rhomboid family serine protease